MNKRTTASKTLTRLSDGDAQMSTFEVNLRLDAKGQPNTPEDMRARQRIALTFLKRHGPVKSSITSLRFASIQILRVEVQADTWRPKSIHRLAVKIGQDCVSVYSPVRNEGALIGPSAEKWGVFSLTRFKRYNEDMDVEVVADRSDTWDDDNDDQAMHDHEMSKRRPVSKGSKARLEKLLTKKSTVPTGSDPIEGAMRDHPGLTREVAERMAENLGF